MTADSEAAQKRFKIWEVITEVYLQNSQRFQKNKQCWLLNRSRSPDWSLQYWIWENNSENCSLVRLVSVKYREESWCVPRCKVIIICLWWPGDDGEPVITGWPTSTLHHSTPLHYSTALPPLWDWRWALSCRYDYYYAGMLSKNLCKPR